jgi:hypothetical protein
MCNLSHPFRTQPSTPPPRHPHLILASASYISDKRAKFCFLYLLPTEQLQGVSEPSGEASSLKREVGKLQHQVNIHDSSIQSGGDLPPFLDKQIVTLLQLGTTVRKTMTA